MLKEMNLKHCTKVERMGGSVTYILNRSYFYSFISMFWIEKIQESNELSLLLYTSRMAFIYSQIYSLLYYFLIFYVICILHYIIVSSSFTPFAYYIIPSYTVVLMLVIGRVWLLSST
jgi:hypothetical protein